MTSMSEFPVVSSSVRLSKSTVIAAELALTRLFVKVLTNVELVCDWTAFWLYLYFRRKAFFF